MGRDTPIDYDKALYRQPQRAENMLPNSRIGGALRHAATDVDTPSSRLSASLLRCSSGSIN